MPPTLTIPLNTARRLAITCQRLAGPRSTPDAAGLLAVIRDLGCVQLDPISTVAPNHQLIWWSRVGNYDLAELDTLLWEERVLFEYWAHAASIVLTEDYPLHHYRMRNYLNSDGNWSRRMTKWVADNATFREYVLGELRHKGPLPSREIADRTTVPWESGGWTTNRHVGQMLDFLWSRGDAMVAGRRGRQRIWDISERCLPDWTPREELPAREVTRRAAQQSLRGLGVGTARHIREHFTRKVYPHLNEVLAELEAAGKIVPVQIDAGDAVWPGWYIHTDDLPLLERLVQGEWQPHTTLLSPFDNLIADRQRTEQLFDYRFRIEIYVPKAKRQYGYYVLSILHGDQIIGRIDPKLDRKQQRLNVNAVYAEPGAPLNGETAGAVAGAIGELARFLGAKSIAYGEVLPAGWRKALLAAAG